MHRAGGEGRGLARRGGAGSFGHNMFEAAEPQVGAHPLQDGRGASLPAPSLTGSEAPGPPPGPGRAGEGNVIPARLT